MLLRANVFFLCVGATYSECCNFHVRLVFLEIHKWGTFGLSAAILTPRASVDRMPEQKVYIVKACKNV